MNEDLIRRSDVLNLATCITKPTYDSPYCESVVYVEDIEAIPSVDTGLTRHGEWIDSTVCVGSYECSQCRTRKRGNQPFFNNVWNYCPNCGAKMDGGVKKWQE